MSYASFDIDTILSHMANKLEISNDEIKKVFYEGLANYWQSNDAKPTLFAQKEEKETKKPVIPLQSKERSRDKKQNKKKSPTPKKKASSIYDNIEELENQLEVWDYFWESNDYMPVWRRSYNEWIKIKEMVKTLSQKQKEELYYRLLPKIERRTDISDDSKKEIIDKRLKYILK
jgi:hypothetical protein